MKKILYIIIAICGILSCRNFGKTSFSDLDFRREHGNEYAYNKDGSVFSGTAWSSDGKTMKIEVYNGVIKSTTVYHSNGNIACTVTLSTNPKNESYYDINGNAISKQQFKIEYHEVMVQAGAFEHEVHYIEK